ncbi:SDR family NAD(P)-dependent oxidoreductase [Streptomyces sp. PT12]|uniref:SDR family NAD(P)-dependent oxidoreductase n=1 Tax=Streptomyces sp. PT12 TaxID=1510197 RepID=UPI000DE236B5|nr:SDR family NAD(P)-dependent oxidoreductase [Streptomyces sp. PT12]RBM12378.1 oxidoreductase [Streptomyces sp. PT12]
MTQEPTLVTTPFDAESTAREVVADVDLTGRRAIVTGATSGIGVETARALAGAGAEVTLAVRDVGAAVRVIEDIRAATGNDRLRALPLDLADQASVADFVGSWREPLHILVNNAGVMMTPETRTPEGWETQFATNHLGHFALATGLHPALAAAGGGASGGARVVAVTSVGHLRSGIHFDDIHFRDRPYDPEAAYGQSKTANVLFAVEAQRRWADDGITVNAAHPGAVLETRLTRHLGKEAANAAMRSGNYHVKSPEQGAATPVLLGTWPPLEGVGGRYFEDCNEAPRHEDGVRAGVADHAIDREAAERLWQVSTAELAAASRT